MTVIFFSLTVREPAGGENLIKEAEFSPTPLFFGSPREPWNRAFYTRRIKWPSLHSIERRLPIAPSGSVVNLAPEKPSCAASSAARSPFSTFVQAIVPGSFALGWYSRSHLFCVWWKKSRHPGSQSFFLYLFLERNQSRLECTSSSSSVSPRPVFSQKSHA